MESSVHHCFRFPLCLRHISLNTTPLFVLENCPSRMTGKSKEGLKKHILLKSLTKQHIYFNIYRRLCVALFVQFVIQSQGPLDLCCSINNQFTINN
jgi:hypothetical protein